MRGRIPKEDDEAVEETVNPEDSSEELIATPDNEVTY